MEYNRIADIKRLHFIIDTFQNRLPKSATVLDVGCGNGIISRGIGQHGYTVYGIDISEKAIEKARALTNLTNVSFDVVSAEQLVADGKKYDAVICSEVLEHLNQPEKLLNTLYQSLTENGILIVTVPNGSGPRELFVTRPVIKMQKKNSVAWRTLLKLKKLFGYKGTTVQSDADDLTHVQFFTKKSLEKLAKQNKFRITRFGVTNFIDDVFPFSLLTRKIKLLQKVDAAIADKLPSSFAGSFVSVWQKAE
ncbi:MAG TPA: methyltransferase domain-containing protein [Flavisolibacter sp.]|jgi:2-polyprenyl-3-methyl-5-hydroxy-6-metoxy-1,4-benzoquinol methylase|nr:methyltransferase domain-containing protein [Flavisolibacter sp.]